MSIGVVFLLAIYFLLAIAAAALLLLPAAREMLWRWLLSLKSVLLRWALGLREHVIVAGSRQTLNHLGKRPTLVWPQPTRQHWLMALTTLLLITLPVMAALLLRRNQPLQGFDEQRVDSDPVVVSLLIGEALVPPLPLPPEVFITREVALVRADLATASREWALLDEDFRHRLLAVYRSLALQGYTLALLEGYRSPQRQTQLQARGTSVTNAGAYQSYHQFGLAADSAFYRDGRLVISERDPWAMRGYQLLGEAAEAQGLRWGGHWQLQDYGHVELRRAGVLGKR